MSLVSVRSAASSVARRSSIAEFFARRLGRGRSTSAELRVVCVGSVVLGEDDPVVAQDVVGVELAGGDQLHLGDVAEAERGRGVVATDDHEHPTLDAERAERGDGVLGPWGVPTPGVDDEHLALAGAVRQRRAQCELDHLLRGSLDVAARLGAHRDTATRVVRRPDRTLTSVAGALLAVWLGAAAAHLAAGLRAGRAGPAGGELGRDDLVHHRDVRLDAEHRVVELDRAGVLARGALDGDLCHRVRPPSLRL